MSARQGFPVSNGYAPAGGPRALPIALDFTNQASYAIDLLQEIEAGIINIPQCIYVDNSKNTNPLSILFDQTNQLIVIPATAQGIWPIITPKDAPRMMVFTTIAPIIANLIILNVPMPLTQWGPNSVTVSNVTATFTPTQVTYTDRSGTVAVGGTSQVMMAANPARKRFIIEAPSRNADSIFINFTNPAGVNGPTSFEIFPGGYFDSGTGPVTTEAINVTAATAGDAWIAKEA